VLEDLSESALALARERLRSVAGSRKDLGDATDADLLRALGVLRADGVLLRAAEVLFLPPKHGSSPRVIYQYRDTPGGEPSAVERLEMPLVPAFARIMDMVETRRQLTPLQLPTGQQIQVEDFPELAVREAVANGLIHRDYVANGAIVVEHSPEVFVVTSPGPLVAGVTPENILTHPSKPRNARLAHAARIMGLVEEVGRGVDRMYREMIRSGRTAPTLENSAQRVRVTLVGGAPDTQLARFVASFPATERGDVDTMLIVLSLCSRRTLSSSQASPILQKTEGEAEAVLRRLASDDLGILEPTRETARRVRPVYRFRSEALRALGSTVAYQRRTTDEIDRKIIDHLREYGKITNRTVRNLLDVKTHRAAAILVDLVKRDIITKTSRAQRGPSVEYGLGPKFPSRATRLRKMTDDRRGDASA
jgi:ATP-dependent DNA helicase RecG